MVKCPNCGSTSFPDEKYYDPSSKTRRLECQECWEDFSADEINSQDFVEVKLLFQKNEFGGTAMKKKVVNSSDPVSDDLLERVYDDYGIEILPKHLDKGNETDDGDNR
jgi:transcriptional regulator NrdR family protein